MCNRWILENPYNMGQRIDLPQMSDVGRLFERVLTNGSNVYIFDGGVRELLRVVERSQAVETVVGHFGDADVSLTRIGVRLRGQVRFGQNAKQRCLAHLWQANDSGFHRAAFKLSAPGF